MLPGATSLYLEGTPMTLPMILAPMFVLVLMTFILGFWFPTLTVPLLRRGEVKAQDINLRQPNWPRPIMQINNSYTSQFEQPVLFYVLTVLAIISKQADLLFVVMAWIFVLARLAHAYVHVTSNDIRVRGPIFGIAALVLAIMWLIFIVRIMFLGL
jgi:hypothetical protein